MRDLLDKLVILTESTGLAGRKPGDTFKSADGDTLVFSELKFYPESGRYNTDELNQALKSINGKIYWQNSSTPRTGGFGIAVFESAEGYIYVGRFLEQIKASFTDNFIPNNFTIDGVAYKYGGKSAEKAQAGLTPQDLLTDKIDLTSGDIISQLEQSLGPDNVLYQVASQIANGEPLPISFAAPTDISFSAFRDYFCEILQPMALQQGQYTGNAGEAAEIFLGGSFEDTLISFDDTKTAGLSDSIMTTEDGKSVKISTKGGRGATASAKNLIDSIDELNQTPEGRKILNKYEEVIEMLREVQSRGQAGAPLYLGVKYDIIDESDAETIKQLKNQAPVDLNDIDTFGLSKNLVELALGRSTDNPGRTSLYYHLLAAVAHKAAVEVNDKTDFSDAAAEILNNGALVQVYTKARQGKDNWTLDEFNTVYPGKSIKGVYFSAGKTYYSTGIKGNFTFKIDKGGEKDKETEKQVAVPSEKEFIKGAEKISKGRATKSNVMRPKAGTGNVGREKR